MTFELETIFIGESIFCLNYWAQYSAGLNVRQPKVAPSVGKLRKSDGEASNAGGDTRVASGPFLVETSAQNGFGLLRKNVPPLFIRDMTLNVGAGYRNGMCVCRHITILRGNEGSFSHPRLLEVLVNCGNPMAKLLTLAAVLAWR